MGAYFHDNAAHANLGIRDMAEYTDAFTPTFSNDLNNSEKYPAILQWDAVLLNSGDGPVFADPEVMSGLMRFVRVKAAALRVFTEPATLRRTFLNLAI